LWIASNLTVLLGTVFQSSFGIVQKSRYAVLVAIPPQRPLLLPQISLLLLPLFLPRRIAVAGMEVRAVVTICGVTKARATVKMLVMVDGLVILLAIPPQLLQARIAAVGMEDRAVVTICGVMKARATVKVLVTVDGLVILAIPLLPAIAAAGMEDRAVVTIGGATKARATVKALVTVDGLVVTALQIIAAAGMEVRAAELASGVTDPWATAKMVAVGSGSDLVVQRAFVPCYEKGTQNHEHTPLTRLKLSREASHVE